MSIQTDPQGDVLLTSFTLVTTRWLRPVCLITLSCGLALLPAFWSVRFRSWLFFQEGGDDWLLAEFSEGGLQICKVELKTISQDGVNLQKVRVFHARLIPYKLTSDCKAEPVIFRFRHRLYNPEHPIDLPLLESSLSQIKLKPESVLKGLIKSFLQPMFIYILLCVLLWLWQQYYLYSLAILVTSVITFALEGYQSTLVYNTNLSLLMRSSLIEGSIIPVHERQLLKADCIILQGSCMIDQSQLTGESIPVYRTAFQHTVLQKNMLLEGVRVVRMMQPLKVLVVRKNFHSVRGKLIRAILYPNNNSITLLQHTYTLLVLFALLILFAHLLNVYTLPLSLFWPVLSYLPDFFSIGIPPALSSSIVTGVNQAVHCLYKKQVKVSVPMKIVEAGSISRVCFDKTGTLTRSQVRLQEIVELKSEYCLQLKFLLGTCHSLYTVNGQVQGESLQVQMLNFIRWKTLDTDLFQIQGHLVRRLGLFQFSPELGRLSVIVQVEMSRYVFSKGSAEVICKGDESAIKQAEHLAKRGYRVIACSGKKLQSNQLVQQRRQAEKGHTVYAFLLYSNSLKEDSAPLIEDLRQAGFSLCMITGDHLGTAVRAGVQSGLINEDCVWSMLRQDGIRVRQGYQQVIVDRMNLGRALGSQKDLAVDQQIFYLLRQLAPHILVKVKVFARVKPQAKADIVRFFSQFQKVAMVGDGANDCLAIRQASLGMSLDQAQTNMSACFSGPNRVGLIKTVVLQSRGGVSCMVSLILAMMLYSSTQLSTVLLGLRYFQYPTSFNFAFWDFFCNFIFLPLYTLGQTTSHLGRTRPTTSLTQPRFLCKLIYSVILQLFYQMLIYRMSEDSEEVRFAYGQFTKTGDAVENLKQMSIVFQSVNFIYLFQILSFYPGLPFREPLQRNKWFLGTWVCMLMWSSCLCQLSWLWVGLLAGFIQILGINVIEHILID